MKGFPSGWGHLRRLTKKKKKKKKPLDVSFDWFPRIKTSARWGYEWLLLLDLQRAGPPPLVLQGSCCRRTQKDSRDWAESSQECLQQVPSQTICSESETELGAFFLLAPRSHPMNNLLSPRLTVSTLSTISVGENSFILVFKKLTCSHLLKENNFMWL